MSEIIVVGAGTMGAGIALVAARAGFGVDLVEPDASTRVRAKERIETEAQRTGLPEAAARIAMHAALPARSTAALAIEAVPERMDLKHAVLAQLAALLPPPAVLATNTSSLAIEAIAAGVATPERVAGIHFFNPPASMELVEIVRGPQTDDATLERAAEFVRAVGKTAAFASDTPGFIVNRVARPFYLQSLRALEAEVAPVAALDALARGAGFRMGPFELMDLIGLDINLATTESIYERIGAERLAPVALQAEMVAANRLGRKTKAGFYEYSSGAHRSEPSELPAFERDDDERVVVLGFGGAAPELHERLGNAFAHVAAIENDDLLDEMPMDTTIVFDAGDGISDRGDVIRQLDTLLPPETAIFVDAYATDIDALEKKLTHPERLVGYGVLGSLSRQECIEIVDGGSTGDDALELAQEVFERMGKRVVLVGNAPGLFLGRVICSIVNEAVCAVQEGVAGVDDVDLAMRLGTNYPIGPIAWGREIGGTRVSHILRRLAAREGSQYAPNRAVWILDSEDEPEDLEGLSAEGLPVA